jgi:hypothetical protein
VNSNQNGKFRMNILKTTTTAAAFGLVATLAYAEAHTMNSDDLIRTRDIVGSEIYRLDILDGDTTWAANEPYTFDSNWENIGSIEDIVLSKDGQMIGIVGEVGGWLGMGDKMVLMPIEDVRLTVSETGEYAYVTSMTEEQVDAAQGVDEGFWE